MAGVCCLKDAWQVLQESVYHWAQISLDRNHGELRPFVGDDGDDDSHGVQVALPPLRVTGRRTASIGPVFRS
jgi:hypothetical protein